MPSRDRLVEALGELIGTASDSDCDRAHFEGIHAIDVANVPGDGDWRIYLNSYLSSMGIPADRIESAIDWLVPLWQGPSPGLWRRTLNGSIAGLQILSDAELKLGVVSNSDGHVEAELVRSKICQVGVGHGVPVQVIIDSAVVGVAKPDPAIFDFALPPLGLDRSNVLYVGDSVKYDVRSAEAASMTPLHFDPFDLCEDRGHLHIAQVADVLHYV